METTTAAKTHVSFPDVIIPRNALTEGVKLVAAVFGKKAKNAGQAFLAFPEITKENWPTISKWFSEEEILDMVNPVLWRQSMDNWAASVDEETGQVDFDVLKQAWQDFTAERETLGALDEKIDTLQDEGQNIIKDENFGNVDTQEGLDMIKRVKEINKTLLGLKEKRAEISAKFAKVAERRAATREANKQKKLEEAAEKKLAEAAASTPAQASA